MKLLERQIFSTFPVLYNLNLVKHLKCNDMSGYSSNINSNNKKKNNNYYYYYYYSYTNNNNRSSSSDTTTGSNNNNKRHSNEIECREKKTAMEFNWLCKITTSILQTSYHIVLLSVCLVAHLVLLPFISSFQFYILHFSLFSPLFISEKKKKEDKKKEKQTNTNTRYLSQFNFFPIGKSKKNSNWYCHEQDIHDWSTLQTIHYSTSGSYSSIVFLINWVHQLPTHAFSICFFSSISRQFWPNQESCCNHTRHSYGCQVCDWSKLACNPPPHNCLFFFSFLFSFPLFNFSCCSLAIVIFNALKATCNSLFRSLSSISTCNLMQLKQPHLAPLPFCFMFPHKTEKQQQQQQISGRSISFLFFFFCPKLTINNPIRMFLILV